MIFISKYSFYSFTILIITILFISTFFIPTIKYSNNSQHYNSEYNDIINLNPNGFIWPIPGYTKISSPFGKRTSPTTGTSSSHSGIDIPAPPGSKLIAVADR